MADVPTHELLEYAAEDADITFQLKNVFVLETLSNLNGLK